MCLDLPVIVIGMISITFISQFCQFKATLMKMALKNLALMKMNITLMKNYHQNHNPYPYKQKMAMMKMNMALKEELTTEKIEDWREEIEDWTEEIENQTEKIEDQAEERGIWEIKTTTGGYYVIQSVKKTMIDGFSLIT